MSRPSIRTLYDLDATTLRTVTAEEFLEAKLKASKAIRGELAEELRKMNIDGTRAYERVSAINHKLKYMTKAQMGIEQDLEEMRFKA